MHAIVQWLENLNIKRNMTSKKTEKGQSYPVEYYLESVEEYSGLPVVETLECFSVITEPLENKTFNVEI